MLFCFCLFSSLAVFCFDYCQMGIFCWSFVFRHQKITHWCINLDLRQLLLCCWTIWDVLWPTSYIEIIFWEQSNIGGRYLLLSTRNTGQSLNYSTDQILKIPNYVSRITCMKYFPREKHWPCVMIVFASFLPVLLLSSV